MVSGSTDLTHSLLDDLVRGKMMGGSWSEKMLWRDTISVIGTRRLVLLVLLHNVLLGSLTDGIAWQQGSVRAIQRIERKELALTVRVLSVICNPEKIWAGFW